LFDSPGQVVSNQRRVADQTSSVAAPPLVLPKKLRAPYVDNMALININREGSQPVGPLGIKKVEQELIKRRYKQPYISQADLSLNPQASRISQVYGGAHN